MPGWSRLPVSGALFPSRSIGPSLTESPRKIGLTSRLRVAGSPPAHSASSDDVRWNSRLVELGASRGARPVRRRLIGLTLGSMLPRLIPMFDPMPVRMWATRENLVSPSSPSRESQRSGAATSEAGASGASCSDKSPRGVTAARPYNPELPRGVLDLATGGTGRMCMRSASRANSGDE